MSPLMENGLFNLVLAACIGRHVFGHGREHGTEQGRLDDSCRGPAVSHDALCKGGPRDPSALSEGERRGRPAAPHRTEETGRKGAGS